MASEDSRYRARKIKQALYGAFALMAAAKGGLALVHGDQRWWAVFWAGLAWGFACLYRLELRNRLAEREEDRRGEEDEKHLYQPALGFGAHPELRRQLSYALIVSGSAVLFGAFQNLFVAMIFWGAALSLAGVILLFAFG